MRDYSKEALSASRPKKDAYHCVNFCLNQLFNDNTHEIEDKVVERLTFEELIGALLLAKDELEERG